MAIVFTYKASPIPSGVAKAKRKAKKRKRKNEKRRKKKINFGFLKLSQQILENY